MSLPRVRRATAADRSVSVDTAARAFANDPFIRHLMPDDERYLHDATRFFGLLFDTRLAGGELWCTDDCTAVAQWNGPDGNRMGGDWVDAQWEAIEPELHPATIPGVDRLDHALDPTWPEEPHWYLGVFATHPDRQGRGLGSAVLAPGLAAADAAGLGAYLVTATEANVAFYAGHGFGIHVEVDLLDGPHIWMLGRPARG
jgi:GNAT superfamily N-acetyltransferase